MRLNVPAEGLRGDGLVLRPLEAADAEAFSVGASEPDVARFAYGDRRDFTVEKTLEYIEDSLGRLARDEAVMFAVLDESDHARFLGQLLMFRCDWELMVAELGFWLMPEERGKGVAGRAIEAACGWAFGDLVGFERLGALTDVRNVAAQRALERAGFLREGVLRGADSDRDGRVDLVSYGRLRSDPPPA